MATTVVSVRVSENSKTRLERFSRYMGKKPSEAGALLLEEGLRRSEHSYIDFRASNIGRQAYIEGTRLPVWFVFKTSQEFEFSVNKTGEHFHLSETKVKAALNYADRYADDIKTAITDSEAANDIVAIQSILPDTQLINI